MEINDEDKTIYSVVINHEEQYSIWPNDRGDPPPGWELEGTTGSREHCLERIDEIWTDMRPLSLRRHLESQQTKK